MPSIGKNSLSLVQLKAAEILATGTKASLKTVAKECGVKPSTVKDWKNDPHFKIAVLQKFEENMSELRSKRVVSVKSFLSPLYKELKKKLKDAEEVSQYSIRELISMIIRLHAEVRLDNAQFSKNKALITMLAEYTGHDLDGLGQEDENAISSVEERYIQRRIEEQKSRSEKVVPMKKKASAK